MTDRLSTRPTLSELADEWKLRRENARAARQRERWTSPRRAEGSSPSPSPFGGAVVYAMGWPEGKTTMLGESLFCLFGYLFREQKTAEWRVRLCSSRLSAKQKKEKIKIMEKSICNPKKD